MQVCSDKCYKTNVNISCGSKRNGDWLSLWVLRKGSLAKCITFELYIQNSYIKKAEKGKWEKGYRKRLFLGRGRKEWYWKLLVLFKGREQCPVSEVQRRGVREEGRLLEIAIPIMKGIEHHIGISFSTPRKWEPLKKTILVTQLENINSIFINFENSFA